jgi:protein-tyrosine phosphatase
MLKEYKISRLLLNPVGEIALSRMPGSVTRIEDDIAEIVLGNFVSVLTLISHKELNRHGGQRLSMLLSNKGIQWHHFPIDDYGTPQPSQDRDWFSLSKHFHQLLDRNRKILIHCYAGVGRSGMIALRLLVERGANPVQALEQIRLVQPGAIERPAQYTWATRIKHDIDACIKE